MKALVQTDGRVAQIEKVTFPVHKDLKWIDCDDSITTDHTYDFRESKFIDHVVEVEAEESLADSLRTKALTAIQDSELSTSMLQEAVAYRAERDK